LKGRQERQAPSEVINPCYKKLCTETLVLPLCCRIVRTPSLAVDISSYSICSNAPHVKFAHAGDCTLATHHLLAHLCGTFTRAHDALATMSEPSKQTALSQLTASSQLIYLTTRHRVAFKPIRSSNGSTGADAPGSTKVKKRSRHNLPHRPVTKAGELPNP